MCTNQAYTDEGQMMMMMEGSSGGRRSIWLDIVDIIEEKEMKNERNKMMRKRKYKINGFSNVERSHTLEKLPILSN